MSICTVSAVGAGIAMPLMFLVFGRLVGDFTGYFTPVSGSMSLPASAVPSPPSTALTMMHLATQNSTDLGYTSNKMPMTKAQFMHEVDQNTLYMVYLGIARFVLSYISMVSFFNILLSAFRSLTHAQDVYPRQWSTDIGEASFSVFESAIQPTGWCDRRNMSRSDCQSLDHKL